jgi:AcrR family transcriptional regulator
MNRIVMGTPAATSYADRRAAMAGETRTRILEACVAILARDVAELSIPAVAREARVSVPTVYRNFADKKTLVHETTLHLARLRGGPGEIPMSVAEVPRIAREEFTKSAALPDHVRAAMLSAPVQQARKDTGERTRRAERVEQMLAKEMADIPAGDRQKMIWMTTVLLSTHVLRGFRELLELSPDDAADTVSWTIARLLGRASLEAHTKGKRSKR